MHTVGALMLEFRLASLEEKSEAFASVHSIWPHADDPAVHLLKRLHSIQHARAEWFVGMEQGHVAVSCGAYPLELYGPGQLRKARGFGAVYTAPEHRGQGYAKALIAFVMDFYRNQKVDDFILFSDIAPSYYERIGFHRLLSWQWEIDAHPLAAGSDWTIEKTAAFCENPGTVACKFGIHRTPSDDVWTWSKHGLPLRKTLVRNEKSRESYWILSSRQGRRYSFLESNIPQTPGHWELLKGVIAADAARARCFKAYGWWASPDANEPSQSPFVTRKDGILMWTSSRGARDPWLPEITLNSFRTFLSEQF